MAVRSRARALRVFWAPSLPRRVLRHRLVRLGLSALVIGAAALWYQGRVAQLEVERAGWGSTADVLVVSASVEPGERLDTSVELRSLPRAMVPGGALDAVTSDSRAKVAMVPGEILLAARVSDGVAGRLPSGTVGITLSLHGRAPLVSEGDLVDVWTIDSANLSSRRVAEAVLVLARSDDDVTLAVRHRELADVTVASLRPVTLALLG